LKLIIQSDMMSAEKYVLSHPMECIFFSEFHHKQGPRITFQVKFTLIFSLLIKISNWV